MLSISMISLGVTEMIRSMKFYGEIVGLPFVSQSEGGQIAIFRAGEVKVVLNKPLADVSPQLVGAVELIFGASSVDGLYHMLFERGCDFVRTPHEILPGTWAATFRDHDGHQLTILGPP